MKAADFASKFRLVLRALNLSRGSVASGISVDKSLVGRWASGVISPSDYNLARLSSFIASKRSGFSMADWDRETADLAGWLGVPLLDQTEVETVPGFPPTFISQARSRIQTRGAGYEGFWRTSRPSVLMSGTIFRDHGMIRVDANGYLAVRMGGAGMTFEGVLLLGEYNLFAVFYNSVSEAPYFMIGKGVQLPRADMFEGLLLLSALDAAHTPATVPIVLERIGDLSGDREKDDLYCAELIDRPPIAQEGEVSEEILARLIRDVGPAAAANGGEKFLMSGFGALSRGSTKSGDLRG
jgi:hypothetical protein